MSFSSLRPLTQIALRRSTGRTLASLPTTNISRNNDDHWLKYLQAIFNRTPCVCQNIFNLTRRHVHADASLCHHPRLRNQFSWKLSPFHDNPLDGRIHLASGIIHRYPIFGSNQLRYLHTSPIRSKKKEGSSTPKPTPGTPEDKDPSLAYERSGQKFLNGPDQVIPSEALYSWNARGAVRLKKELCDPAGLNLPPISIPTLFKQNVERNPNHPALAEKRNGVWDKWSHEDYYNDVWKAGKAFIALGLERFNGVCILGFNSPEWFFADLGAIFAGGIPAGIYTTNSPCACAYIAEDSKANIFIVEDEQQLSKILQYKHKLPHLKAIVQYKGTPSCDGVYSWADLMKIGEAQSDAAINERLKQIAVNQCCTMIYTSGTTGSPKGVMLSHDNITWMSRETVPFGGFEDEKETIVSYLPLSHIAAQTADMYFPMVIQGTVFFADCNALKGSLIDTLREVQPTKFLAVPRVWEKFYEALREIGRQNKGLKKAIGDWAKAQATIRNQKRLAGDPNPDTFQFKLADKLILSKVRKALGLSNANLNMSAAAPLSMEIMEYFMSLNIIVTEAYGLSECSGPHCLGVEKRNLIRFGSIGVKLPGVTTRLDRKMEDGQGEICLGGRHVLMGYLGKEELTKQAIDAEGWLHSEDMGKIDEDGFIFITGRIKELLITAGGENVAPVPIEDNIKQALPCLSNAMVIGDQRKFLAVLISFRSEMDPDTHEALDKLTPASKEWIEKHGHCTVNTVQDVMFEVYVKTNSKRSNASQLQLRIEGSESSKVAILPKDFSLAGDELGPTMKLKRSVVTTKYKDLIDHIYKDGLDPNSTGALG